MPLPLDLAAIPGFVWAAGIFYVVFLAGSWILSRLGRLIVQRCLSLLGKNATFALVDSPAMLLHEFSHLLVALVFGHRITSVDLAGVWNPQKGAHVMTEYNPRRFRHRIGLSLMALAPVALPVACLGSYLILDQGLPHPAQLSAWISNLMFDRVLQLSLSVLLPLLYLHVLIAASMRLSVQDWREFVRGSFSWAAVLLVASLLFFSSGDPWTWRPTWILIVCFGLSIATKVVVLFFLSALTALRWLVVSPVATADIEDHRR